MWYEHVQRFTASIVLCIVYGIRNPRFSSPEVKALLEVHPQFLRMLEFNRLPAVELFPFLKWVPERWANWKQDAKRIKQMHDDLFGKLFEGVESRIENGLETGAFMEKAIVHADEWGLENRELLL